MTHFGIGYTEDLNHRFSEYITDSVDLVNEQIEKSGKRFFFDMADVDQTIIGDKYCWDMFGWVVPNDDVAEFEPLWLGSEDDKLGGYDYVFVGWEDRGGMPHAVIDGDLPEEACE